MSECNKLTTELLETLALARVLSAEAINLLADRETQYTHLREVLKKAVDGKYVRQETINERISKGRFTKQYFTITRKGMKELVQNTPSEWGAMTDTIELEKATVFGSDSLNEKQIRKLIQINDAKMLAIRGGAQTILLPLQRDGAETTEHPKNDDARQTSFAELIRKAMETAGNQEKIVQATEGDSAETIIFTDSPRVKQRVVFHADYEDREITVKDFDRCSFDGILDSRQKFLMVYSCFGAGKTWKQWNTVKDLNIASFWNRESEAFRPPIPTVMGETFEGILLVKNHVQFTQVYKDAAEKRRSTEKLGKGYSSFYASPLSREGAEHLRFLMLTETGAYDRKIAEYLSDLGYELNTEYQPETYLLISPDEHLVVNGTYLDIRRMQRAEEIYNSQSGYVPEILCFDWQIPFYEKTMPFSQLVVIPKI